jgi:hypothetical protein
MEKNSDKKRNMAFAVTICCCNQSASGNTAASICRSSTRISTTKAMTKPHNYLYVAYFHTGNSIHQASSPCDSHFDKRGIGCDGKSRTDIAVVL